MAVVIKSCKNIKQLNKKIIKDIKKILNDKPSSRIGFYWDESLSEIFNALVKTKKIQWFSSRIVPIVEYKDDQTLMFEDILKNHFIDKIDISQGNYTSLKDRINKLTDNGNLNDLYKFNDGLDLIIFGIDKRGNFLFNDFESKISYINYANNGNQLISPGIKSIMLAKQIICIVIDGEADNIVRIINDKKIDKDDIITFLNFHNNITLFTTNNIIKKKEINKDGLSEEYASLYEELFSDVIEEDKDEFKSNFASDDKSTESLLDDVDEDKDDEILSDVKDDSEDNDLLSHLENLSDEEPTQEELDEIDNELNKETDSNDIEIINELENEYDSLSLDDVEVIETDSKDDNEILVSDDEHDNQKDEEFEDDLSNLNDSLDQDDDFGVNDLDIIDTVEIPQEIKTNALNDEDLEILRLKEVQRILEEELKNLEQNTQELKKVDDDLNKYIEKTKNSHQKPLHHEEIVDIKETLSNQNDYVLDESGESQQQEIIGKESINEDKEIVIDEILITEKDINFNVPAETITIIKEDNKPLEIIEESKPNNTSKIYLEDPIKSEKEELLKQPIINKDDEIERLYNLTYQPRTIKRDYVITNPKTKEQIQRIIDIKEDALRTIEQLIIKNRLDQKTLTEKDLPTTQSEFYKVKYIPGNRPTPMLMVYNEPNEQVYNANLKRMIDTYKILINNKSFNSSNKHYWNVGSYISFNEQTNEADLIAFEHFDTFIFLLRAINKPLYFFVKKETAAILSVLASKFNNELLVLKMS